MSTTSTEDSADSPRLNKSQDVDGGVNGSGETDTKEKAPMMGLLLLSIFCSAANTVSYKQTLNAFSSPTTNYSFFVSEFSIFLYILQAS
jgi:hypothetical protein